MHTVDDLIDTANAWNAGRTVAGELSISIGMAVVTGRHCRGR